MSNLIALLILLLCTPCLAGQTIDSYTDNEGNTIYYSRGEIKNQNKNDKFKVLSQPPVNVPIGAKNINQPNGKYGKNTQTNSAPVTLPTQNVSRQSFKESNTFKKLEKDIAEFMTIIIIIGLLLLSLWFYTFIDILRNEFTGSNKIIWFLAVTFFPLLGPILYLIIADKHIICNDSEPQV